MSRPVRRGRCVATSAALAISIALASGCGGDGGTKTTSSASDNPQLRAVVWPALRTLGIAQIETDGGRTWIRTLVPSTKGSNVFSLDSTSLTVRELPVAERLALIVAGAGQLWALPDQGDRLLFVPESPPNVRARPLEPPCGVLADPSGVVALGKLWLSCNGRVSTYRPGGRAESVNAPKSAHLLAASHGVWAVTRESLVGIGGAARGRRIAVRHDFEPRLWQSEGDEAWAVDLKSGNKALIRVDLASGAITRFPLATDGQQIDQFAIGRDYICVALREKPLILRYDRTQTKRPTAQLDLTDKASSSEFQIFLAPGPSYVWVEVFANRETKLFLVKA